MRNIEKPFKFRVEMRLKNAELINAREKTGLTARVTAKKIGISYTYYVGIENMRFYPGEEAQQKICNYFKLLSIKINEEIVFPKWLKLIKNKIKRKITEKSIFMKNLIPLSNQQKITYEQNYDFNFEKENLTQILNNLIEKCTPGDYTVKERNKEIIKILYGFHIDKKSSTEVAHIFNVTRSCICGIRHLFQKRVRRKYKYEKIITTMNNMFTE